MKKINQKGMIIDYVKKPKGYLPRQKLPEVFFENGALYFIKTDVLYKQRTLFPENTIPYIMEEKNSLDVDNEWDIFLANLILNNE